MKTLQVGAPVIYRGSVTSAHGEWEFAGECGSECGCGGTSPDGALRTLQFVLRRPDALLSHVGRESFTPLNQSKEN